MAEALKEVSVRSIVYGGLTPSKTPMQAIAGTEGAQVYKFSEFARDSAIIAKKFPKVAAQYKDILPGGFLLRAIGDDELGSVNMRNAIRKGQPIPLAYLYEKADVHFQMTRDMVFDAAEIWKEAFRRAW